MWLGREKKAVPVRGWVKGVAVWIMNPTNSKICREFWDPHKLQSCHWISPLSCFSNTVKYFIFGMTELRGCSMHTYTHRDSANATIRQNLPRILGWSWLVKVSHRRLRRKEPACMVWDELSKHVFCLTTGIRKMKLWRVDSMIQVYLYNGLVSHWLFSLISANDYLLEMQMTGLTSLHWPKRSYYTEVLREGDLPPLLEESFGPFSWTLALAGIWVWHFFRITIDVFKQTIRNAELGSTKISSNSHWNILFSIRLAAANRLWPDTPRAGRDSRRCTGQRLP